MAQETRDAIQTLLELKSKAAHGIPWAPHEELAICGWLAEEGRLGVLAACCILASEHPKERDKALEIVKGAVKRRPQGAYVQLSLYEALICVETRRLESSYDGNLLFH